MSTTQNSMRPDLEPLPVRMRSLPVDDRGYPVPWFVAWVGGKPEFRAMDGEKRGLALRFNRCWVCGDQLGVHKTFVVGPMCGINRTSAEPPSHLECAEWSARNCPFLSNKDRMRREDDLVNETMLQKHSPGVAIARNPGVTLLWTTRSYGTFNDEKGGLLLRLGDPESIIFYSQGRKASLDEVIASIESGIPILDRIAKEEGCEAVGELSDARQAFQSLIDEAFGS